MNELGTDTFANLTCPPSIDWWITTQCNLNCGFCFGPSRSLLESNELRYSIAENICNSKSNYVTLCGGEPLLVLELLDILKLCSKQKKIILNTNGELLSKSHYVYDYIHTIGISLEGYDDLTYRQMRGEASSFKNCINEIEYAKSKGVRLKIGTVLTKVNFPYISDIAELVKEISPDIWRVYQFSPRGKANPNAEKYNLPLQNFEKTINVLLGKYSTVNISASSEVGTEGCFLIDECGYHIQPHGNEYLRSASCLAERIDDIWKREHVLSGNILKNKAWIGE